MAKVFFYITPEVVLLDFAGAVQVFLECSMFGVSYELFFLGREKNMISAGGLGLYGCGSLQEADPGPQDIIILPGYAMQSGRARECEELFLWLRKANAQGVTICSVCTGAFLLAQSGLLDNKHCTTHWRYTERLQKQFPSLKVQTGKLYVKDKNIYTSAGIATGIDLALFLLEERHSVELSMKVAKEMVVYLKRNGHDEQESPYLQYRDHHDEMVHKAQDWMIRHMEHKISIEQVAGFLNCSPRNLTRVFKEKTGTTISRFMTAIRIEKARNLLSQTDYKFEHVARLCGFKSAKQLRNILAAHPQSPTLQKT